MEVVMKSRSVLVLLAVVVALPLSSLSQTAAGQEKKTSGPSIQFVNPSDYGEARAASARDMQVHGYHIEAAVNQVPSQARVVFEIESEDSGRRRIGTATQEGPDTFGLHWEIPPGDDLDSGDYTLRAILFSDGTQVADDSTDVSVQQSWPTVRIEYPATGAVGVYQPPGQDKPWNTVIDYTYSSGTEIVAFFYSLTPPGQEPEWTNCGNARVSSGIGGGAEEPGSGRHLCELEDGEDGQKIAAVAAIATDDPFPLPRTGGAIVFGDTSGDAHRVLPYRQVPATVPLSVDGSEPGVEGPRQYETGTCTNQIVAVVTDQNGRPVAGANVDVQAAGPDATGGRAALRFDVSRGSGGTDANQPPDDNHQDETDAWSCKPRQAIGPVELSGPGPSGTQGNHRNPSGPDTRHVESGEDGTSPSGRFRFRLYNDQPGPTQITAWPDLDDDDQYCAREPAGHMALGWGQAAPPVAPHQPEQDSCELPGDKAADVGGKSIRRHSRKISINFRLSDGRLAIRGRVRTEHRPCERGVPVRVQRRARDGWRTLRARKTNRRGRYVVVVANREGRYRAVAVPVFRGANDEHLCARAAAQKRYRS
jgi:hypothetical protein